MRLLGETKSADHLMPKKAKTKKIDDDFWPMIDEAYNLGLELRRPFEARWILSLAFLGGMQYSMFNSTAHMLQQIDKTRNKSRIVDNILLPRWRRQVADMVRTKPSMSVVPSSEENEDIQAAKTANKVLRHLWRTLKMKKKVRELAGWIYSCGNAFLDDRWNPKRGPITMGPEGDPIYLGDADIGVWSPFDILVPAYYMNTVDLDAFPWLIKNKFRDLSYIRKNYPKRGKDVVAQTRPTTITGMSLVTAGVTPYDSRLPGATLIEYYQQPCVDYPKGLFITAANGIVLQKADYPYDYYNLEHFKDIDLPGIFWGKSTVDASIPLQIRWNKTSNSIDEFNETAAKGKMLAPKRAALEVLPDDTHGEIITYKPVLGHKPEKLNLGTLPATYNVALENTKGSTQDMFSQHEITQGTNRSDIRSGEMVSLLREQDSFGAIPSHGVFEEAMESVFSRVLKRIQKGYTAPRMISITGKDNEFEVFAFKGADLRNNTDVHVARQSALPDSRVERMAMIERRYEKGLYGDPQDPEVRRNVMNLLEDANIEYTFGDVKLDEVYSRWENTVLLQADVDVMLVNQYDNHTIHVKEHGRFQKSLEYQKLKVLNPQVFMKLEQKFMAHQLAHQDFIIEARRQMIQEEAAASGKGGR